jgi:hypothetical protein
VWIDRSCGVEVKAPSTRVDVLTSVIRPIASDTAPYFTLPFFPSLPDGAHEQRPSRHLQDGAQE